MADEKVLIVDDDPAIRKLLTKVVEGNGFKSVTAQAVRRRSHWLKPQI